MTESLLPFITMIQAQLFWLLYKMASIDARLKRIEKNINNGYIITD